MSSTGFAIEKLYGSVWQFTPSDLDVERSIQFHEPHPSGKIPFRMARRSVDGCSGLTGGMQACLNWLSSLRGREQDSFSFLWANLFQQLLKTREYQVLCTRLVLCMQSMVLPHAFVYIQQPEKTVQCLQA